MDVVDTLYKLIQQDNSPQTYYNNKELFYRFSEFAHLKYYGPKVMDIYKYIITLPKDEEVSFLFNRIFSDLNYYEQYITHVKNGYDEVTDEIISNLLKFIDDYDYFRLYEDKFDSRLLSVEDFTRDYTTAMIVILSKRMLDLPVDTIIKLNNYIINNDYIVNMLHNEMDLESALGIDYMSQYVSRYLPITKLLNGINSIDFLLINIKNGRIKDQNIIREAFPYLIEEFDSIKEVIDFLEASFDNEETKLRLFDSVYDKMVDYYQTEAIDIVMYNKPECKYLCHSHSQEDVLKLAIEEPIENLTYKKLQYVNKTLHDDPTCVESIICIIFNKLEEIKAKEEPTNNDLIFVKNTGETDFKDITFEEAIAALTNDINNNFENTELSFSQFCSIVKAITKHLNSDGLKVYLCSNNSCTLGVEYAKDNVIQLNVGVLYSKYANRTDAEKFKFIETICHETQHSKQFVDKSVEDNKAMFILERLISKYLNSFYECNYDGISFEQDARVHGALGAAEFIRTYFPQLEEHIAYYEELSENESSVTFPDEKQINELTKQATIDDIAKILIALNGEVLEENAELKELFEKDGTRRA